MKIVCITACVAPFLGCAAILPHAAAAEVSYDLANEVLTNPERGFYDQFTAFSEGKPIGLADLKQLREQNISLLLRLYYLEKFRDQELSTRQLRLIEADFHTIRESGCKCILRFAYSKNLGQPDAPLDIVLKHIEQLKPLLQENADVIAVLQAGFIGAWGEWHGSTNDLEVDEARRAIAGGLLDALPITRCIQVRTPAYKRTIVGNDQYLTRETAFQETPQARIGHHNDCFLADETDVGTYDRNHLDRDKWYTALDSRYVAMGGETCQPSSFTEFDPARAELARMHWTYLNRGFNPRVIRQWRHNGLYSEAEKLLGYRLALISSDCDPAAPAGGAWKMELRLKNLGWAAPTNPRDVILVLKPQDSSATYQAKLSVDPRFWLPGEDIIIQVELGIPPDMPIGKYNLYLELPDPDKRLRDRVEYKIRLANKGLWDSHTALHDLKQTVAISEGTRSAPYRGEVWFRKILPASPGH
jgi:hypothetical protein